MRQHEGLDENIYRSRRTYTSGKAGQCERSRSERQFNCGEELMGQANASERGHASGSNHVITE